MSEEKANNRRDNCARLNGLVGKDGAWSVRMSLDRKYAICRLDIDAPKGFVTGELVVAGTRDDAIAHACDWIEQEVVGVSRAS